MKGRSEAPARRIDALRRQGLSWRHTRGHRPTPESVRCSISRRGAPGCYCLWPRPAPVLPTLSRARLRSSVRVPSIGLLIALLIGIVLERRGRLLRSADDLQAFTGLTTLGEIGRFQPAQGTAYPTERNQEALSAYESLVQTLRSRLLPGAKALLVTSADPEDGKSTTAANVATLLAKGGSRVVLVDADLRWSSLRNSLDGPSSLGLTGLLLNYLHSPQLAVARTEEDSLQLLPAGALPDDPEELLRSPRLLDVIESLRHAADYVILDSPPILEAPDAVILASKVDATLLVVRSGKARSTHVRQALEALAREEVRPLGAVLNRVHVKAAKAPQPRTAETTAQLAAPKLASVPMPLAVDTVPPEIPESLRADIEVFEQRLAALRSLRVVEPDAAPPRPLRILEPVAPTGPRLETQLRSAATPQLQSAVGDLLVDLEAALSLIRSLRQDSSK